MEDKTVSVIVPTYNNWHQATKCVKCLLRQTYPSKYIQIIIVNNDPTDPCPWNEVPDNVVIVNEPNPGSYAARNAGLKLADGKIIAFTDSDCQPSKDWIKNAIDYFDNNPDTARIGGRIDLIFKNKNLNLGEIYEKAYAFRQRDFVKKGVAVTANMFTYKYVFESVGLFKEDMMSGGDVEWGYRAQAQGFKIAYVSECIVYHPARIQLKEIVQKAKREAGGHLIINNTLILKVLYIVSNLLPPIRSVCRVIRDNDLTIKEKIIAVIIRYLIRIVKSYEGFLLLLKLKSMDRK